MISFKNNELEASNYNQLCETHNDKKTSSKKAQLSIFKSQTFIKSYHPLKQKKIKLHRLKFVSGAECIVRASEKSEPLEWSTENNIVNWLLSIGVDIKKVSTKQYFLKDRMCFFNNVLVFANKKRTEMGLEPFYLSGITEY